MSMPWNFNTVTIKATNPQDPNFETWQICPTAATAAALAKARSITIAEASQCYTIGFLSGNIWTEQLFAGTWTFSIVPLADNAVGGVPYPGTYSGTINGVPFNGLNYTGNAAQFTVVPSGSPPTTKKITISGSGSS